MSGGYIWNLFLCRNPAERRVAPLPNFTIGHLAFFTVHKLQFVPHLSSF